MLRIAEPYITWGYPNLKSVRELIYKRGFVKVSVLLVMVIYLLTNCLFCDNNSIRDNAFRSLTISALSVNWKRTMYNALKTWSMKFSRLVRISNMCQTFCGPSNWIHPLVGGARRTITTWKVVILAIVKIRSTISSERWFKDVVFIRKRIVDKKYRGRVENSKRFFSDRQRIIIMNVRKYWTQTSNQQSNCNIDRRRGKRFSKFWFWLL